MEVSANTSEPPFFVFFVVVVVSLSRSLALLFYF